MNSDLIFSQIGVAHLGSNDLMLLGFILVLTFALALSIGRSKLLTVLVSTYVSLAILSVVPEKIFPSYVYGVILFFAIISFLVVFCHRVFEVPSGGSGIGFLSSILLVSFFEVLFVFSVVFSIVPKKVILEYISSDMYAYFTAENSVILLAVVPLLVVFMLHRKIVQ